MLKTIAQHTIQTQVKSCLKNQVNIFLVAFNFIFFDFTQSEYILMSLC